MEKKNKSQNALCVRKTPKYQPVKKQKFTTPKQVLENLTEIISLIITLKIYLLKKPLLRTQTSISANKKL